MSSQYAAIKDGPNLDRSSTRFLNTVKPISADLESPKRELQVGERCRGSVKTKVFFGVAVLALCLAPVATAKFKIWLTVSDGTPATGQPVRVVLHAEQSLDYNLKLIAVAPGKSVREVVGSVTGDASRLRAKLPRDGFAVPVTRIAPNRWRGYVRFPRPGRWQLVVPNGAAEGFTIPPPATETVIVGSLGGASTAPASSTKVAYTVALGDRLSGGLLLHRGDRVVCRNPGRWLAVTLPAANQRGVIRAEKSIAMLDGHIVLQVAKNVRNGQGTISCRRIA